jgi:hypothetical protein
MKNSTLTNSKRALLLAVALVTIVPALHASEWGFNLVGHPTVQPTEERELPEIFQMSGAGSFSPEAGTASGQGAFAIFNGLEEPDSFFGGPTFRGTWKVTDFVGWTPDGGLQVLVTFTFKNGLNEATKETGLIASGLLVTFTEEGFTIDMGFELFASEMTGSTAFHLKKP